MGISKRKARLYYGLFKEISVKIPWRYFYYILKNYYGFEMSKKSGSLRAFVKENIRFIVHEPHGKGDDYVHKSDRKKAIRAIEMLEASD